MAPSAHPGCFRQLGRARATADPGLCLLPFFLYLSYPSFPFLFPSFFFLPFSSFFPYLPFLFPSPAPSTDPFVRLPTSFLSLIPFTLACRLHGFPWFSLAWLSVAFSLSLSLSYTTHPFPLPLFLSLQPPTQLSGLLNPRNKKIYFLIFSPPSPQLIHSYRLAPPTPGVHEEEGAGKKANWNQKGFTLGSVPSWGRQWTWFW